MHVVLCHEFDTEQVYAECIFHNYYKAVEWCKDANEKPENKDRNYYISSADVLDAS